jgi:hypothetical protein
MIVREIHQSFSAAIGRLSQALRFEYQCYCCGVNAWAGRPCDALTTGSPLSGAGQNEIQRRIF